MSKFRSLNRVKYFLVKDPVASKHIADSLITSSNDSIILPFTDHPGPLSEQLLSRPFKSLTICDPRPEVMNLLANHVRKEYPNKNIITHTEDLFDLSFRYNCDEAQSRCCHIVAENQGVPDITGSSHVVNNIVKFLVPLLCSKNEVGFLRNVYYQISLKLGLCSNTPLHYYFLLSDRQYKHFTAEPGKNLILYRSSSVLFNTIFRMHRLHSFDLTRCFGIPVSKLQQTSEFTTKKYPNVHLIWMEPKMDLLNSMGPRALIEFRFLVTQLMHKRTRPVIQILENWFDHLGEDLSQIGITDTTTSGDMDIDRYLRLFNYLSGRRDYRQSTFLLAAGCAEEVLKSLD